jgi:CheY-like chemotaxis protein
MKGYLSMSNITILLVDDEISILRALKRTLFEYPFKIIIASSPMEAKEKMADNIIDMIISDYKMPVESGFQLLSFVRDTYPDVIRIMLSGYVEKEVILEALFSCAALTCFPKPWNDEKLLARISELLELKQKFNNPVLWKLINSGSLFSIELPVIQKLEKVNLVINDNEEMTRIISDNMFLLFRVARMVSSDYFNDSSEFNLTKAISIISSDSILKSAFSKPDLYTIMPEIFLSHYDSLFHSMYGSSKPEPLSVYLPFIYIYNYLLFRIDRELYNNRIKAFIADGIPLNSSDRVQVIFKTILRLCGLPEKFMEYCDKVEFDETPEVLTAKKLRDLIELFWWSDSMPEKHSLYTIPSKILDNIYNAVQNFKKLQL